MSGGVLARVPDCLKNPGAAELVARGVTKNPKELTIPIHFLCLRPSSKLLVHFYYVVRKRLESTLGNTNDEAELQVEEDEYE